MIAIKRIMALFLAGLCALMIACERDQRANGSEGAAQNDGIGERDQYERQVRNRLDELKQEIEHLDTEADKAGKEVSEEIKHQTKGLERERVALEKRLDELEEVSEEAWRELRPLVEEGLKELESLVEQARKSIR